MKANKENLELKILSIIGQGSEPVGSGAISEQLRVAEYNISEATVGRILRSFDNKDYTERVGFQGRLLTPSGMDRLIDLKKRSNQEYYNTELISILHHTSKENIVELLEARKAIEGELARLAARNASPEQLTEVRKVLDEQRNQSELGIGGVKEDIQFHFLIAQASGNKVLEAALALIRQYGQINPVLDYIRKKMHSSLVTDHETILQALLAKDPDASRQAMLAHLDSLIEDVQAYWELPTKQ